MMPYEFAQSFNKLAALKGTKVSDELQRVWFDSCENIPEKAFRAACDEWVEGNTRFPCIREIKALAWEKMPRVAVELQEIELSMEERALNKAMFPKLCQWMSKEISRNQFLACLRWEARKAGCEGKIDWDAFEKPVPWETTEGVW